MGAAVKPVFFATPGERPTLRFLTPPPTIRWAHEMPTVTKTALVDQETFDRFEDRTDQSPPPQNSGTMWKSNDGGETTPDWRLYEWVIDAQGGYTIKVWRLIINNLVVEEFNRWAKHNVVEAT